MKRLVVGLSVGGLAIVLVLGLWWRAPVPAPAPEPAAAPASPPVSPIAASPAPEPAALRFERVDVETGQETAEACLVFSRPLTTDGAVHYEDYLELTPPAQPALRRDGQRLCLAGLAFGTEYKALLRQGLPAADGTGLAADTTVPLALRDRPPVLAFRDGLILPRENAAGVPITTVNVARVAIRVLRVPDRMVSQIRREDLVERQVYPWKLSDLESRTGAVCGAARWRLPATPTRR
jgi:uncharacterized protein YfaS (alpha-2-macroglobulin family)